jgi:tetratricopeptide (TPR) repeat protein
VDWDWQGAEQEFLRTIALRPNDASSHQWYGWYLLLMGRYRESLTELRIAQSFDPASANLTIALGQLMVLLGERERGIAELERIASGQPMNGAGRDTLAKALYAEGRIEEAVTVMSRPPDLGHPVPQSTLGFLLAKAGRPREAEDMLRRFTSGDTPPPPYLVAALTAGLGRRDETMAWLDKAYQERSPWITFLKIDNRFDDYRADPRFVALLERTGLAKNR